MQQRNPGVRRQWAVLSALPILVILMTTPAARAAAPREHAPAEQARPDIDRMPAAAGAAADLAGARELFERNLDAIRRRDKDAYLACYLDSEALVRNGAGIR